MATEDAVQLTCVSEGVWQAPGARIIDRTGEKRLPVGDDGFTSAMGRSTLVDKTMLVADVLSSTARDGRAGHAADRSAPCRRREICRMHPRQRQHHRAQKAERPEQDGGERQREEERPP